MTLEPSASPSENLAAASKARVEEIVAPPILPPAAPPRLPPKAKGPPPPIVRPATATEPTDEKKPAKAILTPASSWLRKNARWITKRYAGRSSFVSSAIVHALLLIILGLLSTAGLPRSHRADLVVSFIESPGPLLSQVRDQRAIVSISDASLPAASSHAAQAVEVASPREYQPTPEQASRPRWDLALDVARSRGILAPVETGPGTPLDGRNPTARARLVASEGGSKESEAAVAKGLRWLQAHQRANGSWHFNLQAGPCQGMCRDSGSVGSTTAATALALLPFLGAGHTQRDGEYQDEVKRGLYYLCGRMIRTEHGGDYQEGTMYAQGLTAIALCEAYAMTGDKSLERYAQGAIDFIVYAQHKPGGGWRYSPGEPGDITVSGWQIMALKCGQMAYLRVPPETINYAVHFLDSMQSDSGAKYGYLAGGAEPTATSVGLLSRMVTGWRRDAPPLVRGVRYLSGLGPSKNDMYFDYYATQVMHHWGGSEWIQWNGQMRDYLVESQATEGHESGSWQFLDSHESGAKGGRLYNTCMALMTLEVYYRYLPLYGKHFVDTSF
jgi:hypothetical protein